MRTFYWHLARHAPRIFLRALVRTDTAFDIFSKFLLAVFVGVSNPVTDAALGVWSSLTDSRVELNGVPLWWTWGLLVLIFLHGLFRYAKEEKDEVERERDELKAEMQKVHEGPRGLEQHIDDFGELVGESKRLSVLRAALGEAAPDAVKSQPSESERLRRATKDLLGEAIKEGQTLREHGAYDREAKAASLDAARKWVERTHDLIEAAFDKGEARYFRGGEIDSGLNPLNGCLRRLEKLTTRPNPPDPNPDFDPQEWEGRFNLE